MADIKAKFVEKGKRLITGALTGFSVMSIHSFQIGTDFGFEPSETDEVARGTVVFTGYSGLTQSKAITDDTVRHTILLPESIGPFPMGNLVLFGSHLDGTAIPFLSISLPFTVQKIRSDPNFNDTLAAPVPGSRFVIHVDIKHSIFGPVPSVTVVTAEYANLAFFDTEGKVPPPSLNPYSQFVVNYDTRTKSPAVVSKRSDGTYWGIAMFQNYRDPKFGILDGGVKGDEYSPTQYGFISGYFYTTPDSEYSATVGGAGYDNGSSNEDQMVGGLPY